MSKNQTIYNHLHATSQLKVNFLRQTFPSLDTYLESVKSCQKLYAINFYITIKIEKYPFLTLKFLFGIKIYERQCTCLRKDLTRSFFSDEVNNAVPALWSVCSSANVVSGWLFIDIEGVSTSRWLKSNHQIINVKIPWQQKMKKDIMEHSCYDSEVLLIKPVEGFTTYHKLWRTIFPHSFASFKNMKNYLLQQF